MASHNLLGAEGENAAADFLISKGLIIRERNWRFQHLEVDIIAESAGGCLHIVEVKTRATDLHFSPLQAITKAKIMHLVNAARAYMGYYQLKREVQFDVVTVVGNPGNFQIDYYPRCFYPPLRTYR